MKKLFASLALLLALSSAWADAVVGPGQVGVDAADGAHDLLAVDLNKPAALGPGTYEATRFNYRFSLIPGFPTRGEVTPVLLTGDGTTFTPVAVGRPVSFARATAFTAAPFGGTRRFTLRAKAAVYPGLYWKAPAGPEPRMPVGYKSGGKAFVRYQHARAPVVGTPIGGGSAGTFSRTYDFSITVAVSAEPAADQPAPRR